MEHNTRIISPFSCMLIDRTRTTRKWRIEFHWISRYTLWSRGGRNSTTYKATLEGTYFHRLYFTRPLLAIFGVIAEELNTTTISLFFRNLIDMIPTRERYINFFLSSRYTRGSQGKRLQLHPLTKPPLKRPSFIPFTSGSDFFSSLEVLLRS
jgi:hypothetical protein